MPSIQDHPPDRAKRPVPDFAPEIKALIASFLDRDDAIALSLVNHEWNDIADPVVWREIRIDRRYAPLELDTYLNVWANIERALSARPKRYEAVRHITTQTREDATVTMIRVLCRLERLRSLCHFCPEGLTESDSECWLPILTGIQSRVSMGLHRNTIQSLDLHVDVRHQYGDLIRIFEQMPQLVELRFVCETEDDLDDSKFRNVFEYQRNNQPILFPSLRRLHLVMPDALRMIVAISPNAPVLDEVVTGQINPEWDWQPFDELDLPESGECGITRLDLWFPLDLEVFWERQLRKSLPRWLCKLESVRMCESRDEVGVPRGFPPHSSIKYLAVSTYFEAFWGDGVEYHHIGSRPSDQMTGLISNTVLEQIKNHPAMIYYLQYPQGEEGRAPFAAELESTEPKWEDAGDGMHIRTFVRVIPGRSGPEEQTLYHARCEPAKATWDSLCRHELSYFHDEVVWPGHGAVEDGRYDGRWDKFGGLDHGARWDRYVDLVWFRGLPLPRALLDHIYTVIPGGGQWTKGHRGGELPEEIWTLVEDWANAAWGVLGPLQEDVWDSHDPQECGCE